MLYFSIGYVFEKERGITPKWNTKKVIVACGGLLALEIINYRHFEVLNPFFTIIVGSLLTYLLADIFDRMFPKAKNSRKWNFVINNLFYVYLLHDPLEYIVLRFFMHGEYLTSATGCILFVLFRTIVIFFVSLMMGECIGLLKKNAKKVK